MSKEEQCTRTGRLPGLNAYVASSAQLGAAECGHVHLRKVSIYRDYGTTLELREGLQGGERVALTPPADITEGQQIKVVASPEDAKAAAK